MILNKNQSIEDLLNIKTPEILAIKDKLEKVTVTKNFKKYLKKIYLLEKNEMEEFHVLYKHSDSTMSIIPVGKEDIKLMCIPFSNINEYNCKENTNDNILSGLSQNQLNLLKNNESYLGFNYTCPFDKETKLYIITVNQGFYTLLNSDVQRLDSMDFGLELKYGKKLLKKTLSEETK